MTSPRSILPEEFLPEYDARTPRKYKDGRHWTPRSQRASLRSKRRRLARARARVKSAPKTWNECRARGLGLPGVPCCYVACRWNLWLEVRPTGVITFNFPDHHPQDVPCLCALRIAECGAHTSESIGALLGLTHQGAWGVMDVAMRRLGIPREAAHGILRDPPDSPGTAWKKIYKAV